MAGKKLHPHMTRSHLVSCLSRPHLPVRSAGHGPSAHSSDAACTSITSWYRIASLSLSLSRPLLVTPPAYVQVVPRWLVRRRSLSAPHGLAWPGLAPACRSAPGVLSRFALFLLSV
ncbi:hypothetical protein V8C34DRAFT_284403 [Trichoderma compactum]